MIMEPTQKDSPKLSDMIMCGDHSSFTKTELNAKDDKAEAALKDKTPISYAKITASASLAEEASERVRAISEHALRLSSARRRARSPDARPGDRVLVQAALGSCRWPPYLVAVWVLVLVLTHALHCLVAALDHALPSLRKFCQYFRAWTEECWKGESARKQRVYPLALACTTGVLYALYFALHALHRAALWASEPPTAAHTRHLEAQLTDCLEEVNSNTDSSRKDCTFHSRTTNLAPEP